MSNEDKSKFILITKALAKAGVDYTAEQAEALYQNATINGNGELVWKDESVTKALAPELYTTRDQSDTGKIQRAMAAEAKMRTPAQAAPTGSLEERTAAYRSELKELTEKHPLPKNASDRAKIARSVEIEALMRKHGFGGAL